MQDASSPFCFGTVEFDPEESSSSARSRHLARARKRPLNMAARLLKIGYFL